MTVKMIFHKNTNKFKSVRDELTFSASDNDDAPKSPNIFVMKWNKETNK